MKEGRSCFVNSCLHSRPRSAPPCAAGPAVGPGDFFYDSNDHATKGGLLDQGGNIQVHKK